MCFQEATHLQIEDIIETRIEVEGTIIDIAKEALYLAVYLVVYSQEVGVKIK